MYERRHERPDAFHAISKHKLAQWVSVLLAKHERVGAMAEGSKLVKWLDVPNAPVAGGDAVFIKGHLSPSRPPGRPGLAFRADAENSFAAKALTGCAAT